jgi:hypothetical protein
LKPWATWSALGEKQEGLTIVHFLNKLIVSCKEAVRFPFYIFFGGSIFKLSLTFKISKINLEYVAIFLTEIPQCLQRRHRGFLAFQTYDVTKVSSD